MRDREDHEPQPQGSKVVSMDGLEVRGRARFHFGQDAVHTVSRRILYQQLKGTALTRGSAIWPGVCV
jgi:hypothetical protein